MDGAHAVDGLIPPPNGSLVAPHVSPDEFQSGFGESIARTLDLLDTGRRASGFDAGFARCLRAIQTDA